METKWTHGPWRVVIKSIDFFDVISANSLRVVTIPIWSRTHSSTSEANAHLIAAAPALYEVLAAMVDRWQPGISQMDRIMWERACATLAAARGEKP